MINPAMRSSPVRMMGISSGMDTDFIIQNAMRAHQFRIDQKVRQRTLIEWRQQTHNSIRDQLRDFQSSLLSMTSPRSMFRSNNYNTHIARLTGDNSNGISVSTRANSTLGRFEIRSVNSLARGASITSQNRVSANNQGFALNTRLNDLRFSGGENRQLAFRDDTMGINFSFEGANEGDPAIAHNVTFTRQWPTDGSENFTYTWEVTIDDVRHTGTLGSFADNPYLQNGMVSFTVGDHTFNVTRNASGVLQRANLGTEGFVAFNNQNTHTFRLGSGETAQEVRATRQGSAADGFSYTFEIRNHGETNWRLADRLVSMDRNAFMEAIDQSFGDHPGLSDIRYLAAQHIDANGVLNHTAFFNALGESALSANDLSDIQRLIVANSDGDFTIAGVNPENSLRLTLNDRFNANNEPLDRNDILFRVTDTASAADTFTWGRLAEPIVISDGTNSVTISNIDRNMTVSDLMREINNQASRAGVNASISYDQISDRFTIESTLVGGNSSISVTGLEMLGIGRTTDEVFTSSNNYRDFTVGSGNDEQVVRVTRALNNDDEWVYSFAIQNANDEFENFVPMTFDQDGNATIPGLAAGNALSFSLNSDGVLTSAAAVVQTGTHVQGSTSSITIWDGKEEITLEGGTSNSVDFGGVTINFNSVFTDNGPVVVDITRNVDQVVENITDFINSYNAIITRIEGLLRERRTPAERSYMPLTDEEKQHMTERQIEQWEEIARRGLMRNDMALENLARDLRSSFFTSIEGMGMRPSDLGLSTGDFFGGTGGKIFIDEDRLRAALEEDPDRVMEVFTRNEAGASFAQQGLVARINTTINNFVSAGGSQSNTLRGLERSIRNVNEQIERMTTRMFAEEDRLFRQFAAMERAMSQLQSQGDWFNSMLGAMN